MLSNFWRLSVLFSGSEVFNVSKPVFQPFISRQVSKLLVGTNVTDCNLGSLKEEIACLPRTFKDSRGPLLAPRPLRAEAE